MINFCKGLLCLCAALWALENLTAAAVFNVEEKDLSKNATYTFSSFYGNTSNPKDQADASCEDTKFSAGKEFLLKGETPEGQTTAFRTKHVGNRGGWKGAPNPYIDIQLASASVITKIYIENDQKNPEYANGLIIWISEDGNLWKRVWQLKTVQKDWTIDFPQGLNAKFVRIGHDGWGYISLNKVRIYGH